MGAVYEISACCMGVVARPVRASFTRSHVPDAIFALKKYNSFIFKSKFESLKENVDKPDFSFSVLRQSLHFKDDAVSIVSKNLELRKP